MKSLSQITFQFDKLPRLEHLNICLTNLVFIIPYESVALSLDIYNCMSNQTFGARLQTVAKLVKVDTYTILPDFRVYHTHSA